MNDLLHDDLVEMRAAHVNAGWPADHPGDGARGLSDHDPQVARFTSRAGLSVADVSVVEGDRGRRDATFAVTLTRPLGVDATVCLVPLPGTALPLLDYELTVPCTTLTAGQTTTSLSVPVKGDRIREPDETFTALVLATGGVRSVDATAVGTIVNDD